MRRSMPPIEEQQQAIKELKRIMYNACYSVKDLTFMLPFELEILSHMLAGTNKLTPFNLLLIQKFNEEHKDIYSRPSRYEVDCLIKRLRTNREQFAKSSNVDYAVFKKYMAGGSVSTESLRRIYNGYILFGGKR